jgi:sugar diacid utilization regulator
LFLTLIKKSKNNKKNNLNFFIFKMFFSPQKHKSYCRAQNTSMVGKKEEKETRERYGSVC